MATSITRAELATYLDYTLLKPEATLADIDAITKDARCVAAASVCVNPCWVPRVHELLEGSDVATCTVIGFPLGATTSAIKLAEARDALAGGASEFDMVISIGALRGGHAAVVASEIEQLADCAHEDGALLKVIIETCLLTDDEKRQACLLAKEAGADFVKTSTGFSSAGATVEDVRLMRETVGPDMGVKAAGGIRTLETALAMIDAGATRLGVSAARAILDEIQE